MKPMNRGFRIEAGVVLAITLVILSVLTILGISSMSSSGMQTLLARNGQLKEISFHNAESALIIGETAWDAALDACLNDSSHCNTDIDPPVIPSTISIEWNKASVAANADGSVTYGRYVVEYLGWRSLAGENDKRVRVYRITARGLGPNSQAQTLLQTLFRKCVKTDGMACAEDRGRRLEPEPPGSETQTY